jgi:SAM-dependent methyltransferase
LKKDKLSLPDKYQISKKEIDTMMSNYSHWESNAAKFKDAGDVSWQDKNMMKLEIENIKNHIKDGMLVLDAGCSNGYSTFRISAGHNIKVVAFDYSAKAIEIAKSGQSQNDRKNQITFYHGNILDIDEEGNKFDLAYNIRVLINLPNWKLQKNAILEIHRVLKTGGIYLMSEAFSGSLEKLNLLRKAASFEPLKEPEFNIYLEENKLEEFVKEYFDILEIRRFSSIYYVASRFLRYLTMEPGEKDSYNNSINDLFSQFTETANSGDFGVQKLYVLKKR